LAQSSTADLGTIIETFVARQFPDAATHYWVINGTQWDGDEMVVDMHAIVSERREAVPTLRHFLLLIVAGELRGVQKIPLEPGADCRAEEDVYLQLLIHRSLHKKTTALFAVSQRGRWSNTSIKNDYLIIKILPPTWAGCK
jgi:hypothetical protein